MKKDLVDAMNDFAIRVLKGGQEIQPQELAVLPSVLSILRTLSEEKEGK